MISYFCILTISYSAIITACLFITFFFLFAQNFTKLWIFYEVLVLKFSQIKSRKQYNILMYSLLCRFTHYRVNQLPKKIIDGMIGKSRKDNGTIPQKPQYSYLARINEKYFGKFLFAKISLGKILTKQVT